MVKDPIMAQRLAIALEALAKLAEGPVRSSIAKKALADIAKVGSGQTLEECRTKFDEVPTETWGAVPMLDRNIYLAASSARCSACEPGRSCFFSTGAKCQATEAELHATAPKPPAAPPCDRCGSTFPAIVERMQRYHVKPDGARVSCVGGGQ